jgi:hypothetical protein
MKKERNKRVKRRKARGKLRSNRRGTIIRKGGRRMVVSKKRRTKKWEK